MMNGAWWIADCLNSFFLVTQSFSPNWWLVTFYIKIFFSAGRVRVHTCCECYSRRGYIRTYLVRIQNFLFHFPFDEIYRRLLFFTLSRAFCFRVSEWIDYTTKWNRQTRQHQGKRPTSSPVYQVCTLPRLPCPCTKRQVMVYLTSTGVCNTGTSALYVCNLLLWLTWWWMLLYRTLRKVTSTTMRKKHVRRDSKMCCCCCRFCCGAPTTDERIHAPPVLHDASQIAYCRYWGRASLPPITSN